MGLATCPSDGGSMKMTLLLSKDERAKFAELRIRIHFLTKAAHTHTHTHTHYTHHTHTHTHTHSEYIILLPFHSNNICTNAPHCYAIRAVPVLLNFSLGNLFIVNHNIFSVDTTIVLI